jgi:putative ABC transport system permease protein
MTAALRMAWRETRGAGRHFAYFAACVTVGVAAIVAVSSLAVSLDRTVARSAKALMGGDAEIRASRPLSADAEQVVSALGGEGVAVTRIRELVAMAQAVGAADARSQLVEIKAVEPGYPFYGQLGAQPDAPLAGLIGSGRALVHASLLERLGLRAGDRLRIGDVDLTISGVITQEPDRAVGVFSLGPRVLIAGEDLDRSGLVRPGSRVRYRTLFRLADGANADAFVQRLAQRVPDAALRITTYAQAQPGLRRFWDQLAMYLGLTGLVALMVGGIGVAVSVRAFVRGKLATIAILKSLGASSRQILAAYLGQTALLGLGGSLLGAAVGSAIPPLLGPLLARLLPFPVDLALSPLAIAKGLALGVGVTLLFALWPLLEIRRVPPALILRRDVEPELRGRRPWLALLPIALGLAALALWQAGSWKIGGLFIGGLGGALLALGLGARLIVLGARRARARGLAWRQAAANLHRPGSHAGAVLASLGLGVMLVVAVALLEGNLRDQLISARTDTAPAFFFIDIQPDQVEGFRDLVTRLGGTGPDVVPIVRARLQATDGAPISPDARTRKEDPWYLTREYALTWSATAPGHNSVVAGRWWTADEAARAPLISVEEDIAKQLGVGLGGTLTFDVQGVPVTARVVNLRRVNWDTFTANFFVIFSPGVLDGAPTTFIATARVRPEDESRLQSAVVAAFPNVTAIPVREVLVRLTAVLDQIALAMRLVAGLSIVSALVVMIGALSITRSQRLYQSVILKALGATRGFLARVLAVEYALLGAGAGLLGTALAALLEWALLRFAFDGRWAWAPGTLILGVVAATGLAVVVGILGTSRLLAQRPLGVLRGE